MSLFRKKTQAPTIYNEEYELAIVYGDIHFPHQSNIQTRILLDVIQHFQPKYIVDLGDLISADCLSTFDKYHSELVGLQKELKMAHAWFESINAVAPKAEKILIFDNHFFRRIKDKFKRGEWWMQELDSIQPETLLKLDEYGWKSMKSWTWKGVLMMVHGDHSSGSSTGPINTARKDTVSNGVSVVRGHTHSTGMEIHKHVTGYLAAIQIGTLEDLDKVTYIAHPSLSNWSNSFGLFYLSKKTKQFFYVPVVFVNNTVIVNGVVFK